MNNPQEKERLNQQQYCNEEHQHHRSWVMQLMYVPLNNQVANTDPNVNEVNVVPKLREVFA